MKITSIAGILFIALVAVQLYVPMRQAIRKEQVWRSGTTYKMQLAPVDPNDPFRGKYMTLSFKENRADVTKNNKWQAGDQVFVYFTADAAGILHVDRMATYFSGQKNLIWLKANVRSITNQQGYNEVIVEYPFERFYLDEWKAPKAEESYQAALLDSSTIAYGSIGVLNGDAVVKDIIVNGKSILK